MLKDLCAQVGCERVARDLNLKIDAFMDDISFAMPTFEQLWMIENKIS
jgi:hypothetical protein